MSQENADRLKQLSSRLENMVTNVKSGNFASNEEDFKILDQLDHAVTEYENILEKERKMS
jgi:hypothetical protein